jgi:hypothetical protein
MKRVCTLLALFLALAPLGSHADDTTAAPNDSGEQCTILTDVAGDQHTLPAQRPDTALDIRSLDVASNEATLVLAMQVAHLGNQVPAGELGQWWQVGWSMGDKTFNARAQRTVQGTSFVTTDAAGTVRAAVGSLDQATDTITLLVPHRDIPFDNGTVLTSFTATSYQSLPGSGGLGGDQAPDTSPNDSGYVVGAACADQPMLACPVVLDPSGDASPDASTRKRSVSVDDGSLDLISTGAQTSADTLSISARVVDLKSSLPPGFDTDGWTISWSFAGTRYVAQAARSPKGQRFSYAATSDDGSLSGPIFGATATTGSIDPSTGLVRIDVPRDTVGAPTDGDLLRAFGAVAWAAHVGNPTAYHVFDQTSQRRYAVGVSCGA